MRLRLLAVLLAALILAPVSAQAPFPPPPKGPLPPPPPVGVVPVPRPPLPLPLPPPVPPRLVTPITVQEYVVDYLVLTPPGRAIIASDYRLNRMRITTIRPVPLPPPPPPFPPPPVPVPVVPVPPPKLLLKEKKDVFGAELRTMKVVKWTCGRLFEEADGRRWILVHGTPISEKPPELAGWVMPTESGVPSFMTRSGRLFQLAPGSK